METTAQVELPSESSIHKIWDAKIIATVLAVKVLLFLFAGQSYQIITDRKLETFTQWISIWNVWDTAHYRKLAEFGYGVTNELKPSMVFYPLYPWLIKLVSLVTQEYFISALLISTVASIAMSLVFFRLVKLDHSTQIAARAFWFLIIFPTSYFLHIGYTESLFLLLVFSSIYAARTNRWVFAGLLGALACMTRANGLVLFPVLAIEAITQYRSDRKLQFGWLWIAIVPAGFLVYLAINYSVAGDPFAFIAIRKQFFFISSAPFWTGVTAAIGQMQRTPSSAEMVGVQEVTFIALGLVCSIVSWFKLRPSYSAWITISWVLFVSVDFVASVPRYTLTMFPIFLLFAMLAKNQIWMIALTVWSLLYLSLFSGLFSAGRWAF
jgi:Predicted integral membrane protein